MMVKFLDLQKINAQYAGELKQVAAEVIDSGWYLLGERTSKFEKQFSDFTGAKHTVACGNGLDALRLILKAYIELGVIHCGDEVIVPANTYIATILAITDNGLKPVLVEPDIKTYNLDIASLEKFITPKTKAIMPVHLYGRVCWAEELEVIAEKYKIKIIEDNAQAVGACYFFENGTEKRTANLGDAAGNSFYPGKNLGALGDSGAVTTDDDELAAVVRALANYGSQKKYINTYQGLNSRMDELQAAFLSVKLKYLDAENELRRVVAGYYTENIKNKRIMLPSPVKNSKSHVYHLFVVRTKNRDEFQKYLAENNIQTLIHYPVPPHKQDCYKDWNEHVYPVTGQIHDEILSLPMSPALTRQEVEKVVEVINVWNR